MRARLKNARTPNEVFFDESIRIPRRVPDESFGYLFFDVVPGGRVVGNNGVRHDGRIYRLDSLRKHLEYWGERVDVRINPDDQRVAMIFDWRSGAYVCKAHADLQDATYDTRDEVTRALIARVFSDGKHLLQMAKEHVEGAKERLVEYRRAKIAYLTRRAEECEAARNQANRAASTADIVTMALFSGVPRHEDSSRRELTPELVAEVLTADLPENCAEGDLTLPGDGGLCVARTARRQKPARLHRLTIPAIAKRLGRSDATLRLYVSGKRSWPVGMKEEYEALARLSYATAEELEAALSMRSPFTPAERPPSKSSRKEKAARPHRLSVEAIAKHLGRSDTCLRAYRSGARPWPAGMREAYEELSQLSFATAEELKAALAKATKNVAPVKRSDLPCKLIAAELGITPMSLLRYRCGKRTWPDGMEERFNTIKARYAKDA